MQRGGGALQQGKLLALNVSEGKISPSLFDGQGEAADPGNA